MAHEKHPTRLRVKPETVPKELQWKYSKNFFLILRKQGYFHEQLDLVHLPMGKSLHQLRNTKGLWSHYGH